MLPPAPSSSSQQQQHHLPTTTTTNTATDNASHPTPTIALPIDFDTQSQISGSESQILRVKLRPNQILHAESGAMLYMTRGIHMETSMGTSSSSSAFAAGLTRVMTGQNWMISEFRYHHLPSSATNTDHPHHHHHRPNKDDEEEEEDYYYGTVGLGTDFPAKILKFQLSHNHHHDDDDDDASLICQKGAYLAGSHDVTMDMAYVKSFAGGFFGGEGFILQRLRAAGKSTTSTATTTTTPTPSHHSITNHRDDESAAAAVSAAAPVAAIVEEERINTVGSSSTVFLKAYGTVVKRDLRAGEKLRVSSGCLVCMTPTIDFDVAMMTGFANVAFGGQGLFVTTLTGPGTVWLQSMPMDKMVSEIARRVPSGGGIGWGVPIMGGGGGGADSAGVDGDAAVLGSAAGEDGTAGGGDAGVSATTTDGAAVASTAEVVPPSSSPPSDPESPESLFGDAAFGGGGPRTTATSAAPLGNESSSSSSSSDVDASSPQSIEATTNDVPADLDESTISSKDDDLFEDDGTTFTTYDDGGGAGGNATETMSPTPDDGGEGSGGSSILGQLWDLFRDLTDRD